eukprot:jgi/Tetstr1/450118/TSEL_037161.t1
MSTSKALPMSSVHLEVDQYFSKSRALLTLHPNGEKRAGQSQLARSAPRTEPALWDPFRRKLQYFAEAGTRLTIRHC